MQLSCGAVVHMLSDTCIWSLYTKVQINILHAVWKSAISSHRYASSICAAIADFAAVSSENYKIIKQVSVGQSTGATNCWPAKSFQKFILKLSQMLSKMNVSKLNNNVFCYNPIKITSKMKSSHLRECLTPAGRGCVQLEAWLDQSVTQRRGQWQQISSRQEENSWKSLRGKRPITALKYRSTFNEHRTHFHGKGNLHPKQK